MNAKWREATLMDLVSFQRGYDITKAQQRPGPYSVVSSSGVSSYHDEFKAPGPGVVIGRKGTLGTVFYMTDPYWPHDTTLWVTDFHGNDAKFAYYFLKTMRLEQFDVGAANPTLNRNHIHGLPIRIPDVETQRRIADILSAYDDLIENNTKRIKVVEQMVRSLYREWFVNFRFAGHEKVKMVSSRLGKVPEGWEVLPIRAVLEEHIGGGWGEEQPDDSHSVKAAVIRGTDLPRVRMLQRSSVPVRFHKESNARSRRLRPNDVIMEVSGGGKEVGVGRVALVTARLLEGFADSVICASFCKRLVVNHSVTSPLCIYLHLDARYDAGDLKQYEVQSTGIKNFKFATFLEKELVVVPPSFVRRRFLAYAEPLTAQAETLAEKNNNLRETRDILLPRLISGEFAVDALGNEEGPVRAHEKRSGVTDRVTAESTM